MRALTVDRKDTSGMAYRVVSTTANATTCWARPGLPSPVRGAELRTITSAR